MLKMIRVIILSSLLCPVVRAEDKVSQEGSSLESSKSSRETEPLSSLQESRSAYGLGLMGSRVSGDLQNLHGPGFGVISSYRYTLGDSPAFRVDLGMEMALYQSKKSEFINQHLLLAVQHRMLWMNSKLFSNGFILGLELDYWRNALQQVKSEILHDDILFGLQLGYALVYKMTEQLSMDLSFIYHQQEFNFRSTYLTSAFQLVWRL